MKKVYQDIQVQFTVEDDVDVDEVLFEMKVELTDTTGHTEDSIDWEYTHQILCDYT